MTCRMVFLIIFKQFPANVQGVVETGFFQNKSSFPALSIYHIQNFYNVYQIKDVTCIIKTPEMVGSRGKYKVEEAEKYW